MNDNAIRRRAAFLIAAVAMVFHLASASAGRTPGRPSVGPAGRAWRIARQGAHLLEDVLPLLVEGHGV